MVTNIIEADSNSDNSNNIFVTLQHTVNEALRAMLPTTKKSLCVIHPIAVFYGD